jgi:hypothetical protein
VGHGIWTNALLQFLAISRYSATAKKLLCGIVKQSKINYTGANYQGDQIGRFVANCEIIWGSLDNHKIWATNFNAKSYVPTNFVQKCLGRYFWRFFHKLIWSRS